MFNVRESDEIVVRKASAHRLGYLHTPYDDAGEDHEDSAGVHQWQEDLWREIIRAARAGKPNAVNLEWREEMKAKAASRYGASKPSLLRTFGRYNEGKAYVDHIKPFNFMLWFHAREIEHVARLDPAAADWKKTKPPRPAAPYDEKPARAVEHAFDRETFERVDPIWLKSYAEILRTYARHAETKFLGGEAGNCGVLNRRHVRVNRIWNIGKEADRWEDDEDFGADVDSVIQYGLSAEERLTAVDAPKRALRVTSHRDLSRAARISERTLQAAISGADGDLSDVQVARLRDAAENFVAISQATAADVRSLLDWARERCAVEGRNAFADRIGVDRNNLSKILAGTRPCSEVALGALRRAREAVL